MAEFQPQVPPWWYTIGSSWTASVGVGALPGVELIATKFKLSRRSPGVSAEMVAEVTRAPAMTSPFWRAPLLESVSRAVRNVTAGGSAPGSRTCV